LTLSGHFGTGTAQNGHLRSIHRNAAGFLAFGHENQYLLIIRLAAVSFDCAGGLFPKDIDQLNGIA
jgi:hypothetical protein